jgi:hypothetical protein
MLFRGYNRSKPDYPRDGNRFFQRLELYMTTPFRKILVVFPVCLLLLFPSATRAAARSCFQLPDEQNTGSGARVSSSRRVTLGSRIVATGQCEYALAPEGPWSGDVVITKSGGETDFAGLALELQRVAKWFVPEQLNSIFARPKKAKKIASEMNIESVFLAGCTEYLLSDGRGFSLNVPIETQKPTITRNPDEDDCGEPDLSLHFIPAEYEAPLKVLSGGPWASTLASATDQITLDPGGWAIYASRKDNSVGYLIGRIHSTSSLTPLRVGMLGFAQKSEQKPWLRATWTSGGYGLEPATEGLDQSDNWAELRTAAAANALWLAKSNPGAKAIVPIGKVMLADEGKRVVLPASTVSEIMVEKYGDAGQYLVPTLSDWQGVNQGLEVCLAPRYQAEAAQSAIKALPPGSICAGLQAMTEPLTIQGAGATPEGQICVSRRASVMTAFGAKQGSEQDETCASFDTQTPETAKPDFLIASIGDSLRFSGAGGSKLFVCIDNKCAPMPLGNTRIMLDKPGLIEIRLAESKDQANSIQGLTLLRLGVIDPITEWHPVGLYTSNKPPPANRWTTLEYDEDDVFTYVRRSQQLIFRFSTSTTVPATFNARTDLPSQMTQEIPVVGRVKGSFAGTKPSTFVALVTREPTCPKEPAQEFRQKPQVNPDDLLIDQMFYVHFAQYHGENKPYRCISRAGFRVAERLSISAMSMMRFGLLGDTQAVVFMTRKTALGLAFPLAYGYLRLVYGLGVDASLSLTAASTITTRDPGKLTRAGLGFSAALTWGPDPYVPRLISFGGMLHAATGAGSQPWGSLYFGLNLSTLIDLAGGR